MVKKGSMIASEIKRAKVCAKCVSNICCFPRHTAFYVTRQIPHQSLLLLSQQAASTQLLAWATVPHFTHTLRCGTNRMDVCLFTRTFEFSSTVFQWPFELQCRCTFARKEAASQQVCETKSKQNLFLPAYMYLPTCLRACPPFQN